MVSYRNTGYSSMLDDIVHEQLRSGLKRGWKTDGDNALGVRLLFSGLPDGAVVIDELN